MAKLLSLSPTAVDADGVCASQTPGAGVIVINGALSSGGVATFGAAQLVRLTSGGNDSGITFTFTGTDADGNTLTETVAGTNASNSDTTRFFKTVTSITKSGASAGTIVVGNLITSISGTYYPEPGINPFSVGMSAILISGTGTFGVEQTYSDKTQLKNATVNEWFAHATHTGASASAQGSILFPVTAIRLKATASTSLVLQGHFIQAGE